MNGVCKLRVGGKEYDVVVHSAEMHHNAPEYLPEGSSEMFIHRDVEMKVEINGSVKAIREYEEGVQFMYEDRCETACEEESPAQEFARSKMSANDKLLLEKGIVRENGTLTSKGADLLLQMLFDSKKTEIAKFVKDDK